MNVYRTRIRLLLSALLVSLLLSSPADALSHSAFLPLKETQTPLSWGGVYHRVDGLSVHGWVTVHYVTIDPMHFRPAVALSPSGIGTTRPLLEIAQATGAVVGINANFFDPPSGLPIGFLLKDGQVLNTPYSSRATLAIGFFGELHFLNPRIALWLRTAQDSIPLDGVNRPISPDSLVLYTPEYTGPRGPWPQARAIAIRDHRVISIESGRGIRPATPDTYWLVAAGRAQARVADLLPADRVQLDYSISPEIHFLRDVLQAGPMLLRHGQSALTTDEGFQEDLIQKPAARSALARTRDGTLLLLIVTRGQASSGLNLPQLARYLQALGAVDALAFDGGGSSSLVFQDGSLWRSAGSSTRGIPVGLVFLRR
jgi:hypothetical protein